MEKLEFYNMTFNYFSKIIPKDFEKVIFIIDSSNRNMVCPVRVEFCVFFNETDFVFSNKLPLYSKLYQGCYNEYVRFFKDNYASISEFDNNNILTLIFTNNNQVYDYYERADVSSFELWSDWRKDWDRRYLNINIDDEISNQPEEMRISDLIHISSVSLSYDAFLKAYPDKNICPVYDAPSPYVDGGEDPINSISVYDCDNYWHLVTEGCYSYCDYEFTFLLAKSRDYGQNDFLKVLNFMQPIAMGIFEGQDFDYFDYVYDKEISNIGNSSIAALIAVEDPYVSPIDGLRFMCLVGITVDELKSLDEKRITTQELYDKIGAITDFDRKSVV